ncbi:MAG: hypothetical protein GXW96_02720 [Christensenellaceae bacterium]|nr:hypothetical protein [Christensenellaceae bacterium]
MGKVNEIVFNTVPVTFKLQSSIGLPLKGDAWFYSGGWQKFGGGSTGETIEMLPTSYTFKVEYGGASIQKTQTLENGVANVVVFKTKLVLVNMYTKVKVLGLTVKLPLPGGKVSYYAGGWKDLGKAPVLKEMLPTSYTFALEFMGQRQQKAQNVADDATVEFEIPLDLYLKALKEGKI